MAEMGDRGKVGIESGKSMAKNVLKVTKMRKKKQEGGKNWKKVAINGKKQKKVAKMGERRQKC